jgi:CobW/HypB/UreG, nucleotide-binding domain/UreF
MPADPILWLFQANDSAYPSGAYAHSFGLEELVESGVVLTPADLENFLLKQVLPALLTFEIPSFTCSHAAAVGKNPDALLALDAELDAWRIPAELRDASRRIGSQRLDLLARLDPSPLVAEYRACSPRSHHLVVTALENRHPDLRLILIESGGDNLSATFSPELVDAYIYVIDVAEGDKIPRKGGPAIRASDLLLINKTELAPYVGADLEVMAHDSKIQRGTRPFLFADLKSGRGKDDLLAWLKHEYLFI